MTLIINYNEWLIKRKPIDLNIIEFHCDNKKLTSLNELQIAIIEWNIKFG